MLEKIIKLAVVSATLLACSPAHKVESLRNLTAEKVSEGSKGTNTILIGENHFITEDDYIFHSYILPSLAEKGYKHLVIEVDFHLQDLADNLPASLPKLRESISKYSSPDSKVRIIEQAHNLGYKVHFADDFSLHYKGKPSERNKRMAEIISSRILEKDPKAKIVGFYGAAHVVTKPFFRPDVGTVSPLGFFLTEMRDQEPYSMAILPGYEAELEYFKRFEGNGQNLEIVPLSSDHLRTANELR